MGGMTYTPPFRIEHRPSNFANAGKRTFDPKVLLVVHVTGNSRVAAYPEGFGSAESPGADWRYAAQNSASKDGPSAHNYVGRKTGATIQMWNPRTHWAWSNGDLVKPNVKLPGVAYLVKLKANGTNANAGCYREIELSGYPGSFDPTDAQIEAAAYFAAIDSIATGLDIVRGETVLTHADINSVDRQNCAFRPVLREGRLGLLIHRAREIRDLLNGDTQGDDMPGPNLTDVFLEPGWVTVKPITGVQAIQSDDLQIRDTLPPGTRKPTIGKARVIGDPFGLDTPTESRHIVRLIAGKDEAGVEQSLAVILASQTDFEPAPVAAPDCTAQVDAAKAAEHERTRAAAIAAVSGI